MKLSDVADKIQDGTHFSPTVFEIGDYMYITSKNVKNGFIDLSNVQYISKENHLNIYKRCDIKKGDVILTKDGTIGQVCVNELENQFSILSSVAFIRPNKKFSNYFIYQVLVSPLGQKEIESQIAGQALKRITLTKINNFEYYFPLLREQRKIASFLSAVDEKLQSLKKKKELLEQYKKGVMQKLFSQELRFKEDDGNNFPEWEVKNGNEIFDSISNKNHKSDLPILAITQEHGAIPRNLIDYSISVTDKSIESYKVVQEGDYIISLRSFQGGIEYSNYEGICSPAYIILRPNVPIDNFFYKSYFKTRKYIKELQKNLEGIRDGKMVSYKYFSDIKLPYPCIKEQTKITNFLSALDDKINTVQIQIKKTETWKKGLLQKMFV